MELDFSDPEVIRDPYPHLARLRAAAPVSWHEPTGRWLAASHATVGEVLRGRGLGRIWRDWEPAEVFEPFNLLHRNQMMENEPPAHTRLRSLVAAAFARGHVERLRPAVAARATALLAAAGDEFDLIADVAGPLAVDVIAELLGVPRADRHRLRPWSRAIVRMYDVGRTPAVEAQAVTAAAEFAGYLRELAGRRRAEPRGDLLSHLVTVRDGGDRLSPDELVASAILLLNAGHEASVNALAGGFVALCRHPEQLARVRADRSLVPSAVEEMLRYDPPLHLFERTATADVTIGGVRIAAGQQVAALLGAANRDPAVFAAPDTFDAGRDPNPHVGFGAGRHFCLGAPLARLELQAALTALLDHRPALVLAEPPRQRPTFVLRGYTAVRLAARRRPRPPPRPHPRTAYRSPPRWAGRTPPWTSGWSRWRPRAWEEREHVPGQLPRPAAGQRIHPRRRVRDSVDGPAADRVDGHLWAVQGGGGSRGATRPARTGAAPAGGQLFHCVLDSILMFAALISGAPFGYPAWLGALAWSALGNVVGGVGLVAFLRLARVPHRLAEERARPD